MQRMHFLLLTVAPQSDARVSACVRYDDDGGDDDDEKDDDDDDDDDVAVDAVTPAAFYSLISIHSSRAGH
jgi:hypothetical protein